MSGESYACTVDIGGTHTDAVVIDSEGQTTVAKAPSTPNDFSNGFFDSLTRVAGSLGLGLDELFSQTELVSHGTTVGTNSMIERDGANTALITTRGIEDVLFIMRGADGVSKGLPIEEVLRYQDVSKPEPFVIREQVYGVDERLDSEGATVVEFHEEQAREIAVDLAKRDVDAIAISFLWSFLDDSHERRMERVVKDAFDETPFLSLGSELAPRIGEYERTTSAAINAYVGPTMAEYVGRIRAGLNDYGYDGPLLIMETSGGVVPSETAIREPVRTIHSGPAGGIIGCSHLGSLLGHDDIIATDMGGTSFDVGLIMDGESMTRPTNVIDQYEYVARNLGVETIGSGGGSVIQVDETLGRLTVGPQSVGADPGPVCYNQGGTVPTITDVDLVLGLLDPDDFLGGRKTLNEERAGAALGELGEKIGMDAVTVARGVVTIATEKMADLVRELTVRRGYDPRKFVVYSYGGAGPVHAATVARKLDVETVVVPAGNTSGVWSAVGVGLADINHIKEVTDIVTSPFDDAELTERYEDIEAALRERIVDVGLDEKEVDLQRYADMRYRRQIHELSVPVPDGPVDTDELIDRFEATYESLYGVGSGYSAAGYELVVTWCRLTGSIPKPALRAEDSTGRTPIPDDERKVYWSEEDRALSTTIHRPAGVGPGVTIDGPAIVQMSNTTIAVPPTDRCEVDQYGNYVITIGGGDR